MKKNLFVIFLLVILFFGMVFAAYLIGFKLYFNSGKLSRMAKKTIRTTFQREATIAKITISPFGTLKIDSFAMAAKGGFGKGTVFSFNSMESKINIIQMFRRQFMIDDTYIDGIKLNLNYENHRKFNYANFFANVKYLKMNSGAKQGLFKKIELKNIRTDNGSVKVKTDSGEFVFKNISIHSNMFNLENNFTGKVSFDFAYGSFASSADCDFEWSKNDNIIFVNNLVTRNNEISAEGKIKLLQDGSADLEYVARVNMQSVISLSGAADLFKTGAYPVDMEDIIIYYPSGSEKQVL